jgi:hypothetical protein
MQYRLSVGVANPSPSKISTIRPATSAPNHGIGSLTLLHFGRVEILGVVERRPATA